MKTKINTTMKTYKVTIKTKNEDVRKTVQAKNPFDALLKCYTLDTPVYARVKPI